jgi:hypothetical protein
MDRAAWQGRSPVIAGAMSLAVLLEAGPVVITQAGVQVSIVTSLVLAHRRGPPEYPGAPASASRATTAGTGTGTGTVRRHRPRRCQGHPNRSRSHAAANPRLGAERDTSTSVTCGGSASRSG